MTCKIIRIHRLLHLITYHVFCLEKAIIQYKSVDCSKVNTVSKVKHIVYGHNVVISTSIIVTKWIHCRKFNFTMMDPHILWSIGWLVSIGMSVWCWSVCRYFLKGRKVALPCSFRSTSESTVHVFLILSRKPRMDVQISLNIPREVRSKRICV